MTMLKTRPRSTETSKRNSSAVSRLVAFSLLVLACWAALLGTVPSPSGNPVLRSTSPGNTETVKSPDQVLLTFDRPVPAGLATVRIINPPGDQVIFERPVNPAGRGDTISVPLPKQRYGGTYTVAWTLPSDQLEPIAGTFTFDVFQPSTPVGVPEIETRHDPVVAAFHTTARVAAVAALALLIGAVFFVAAIWPAGAQSKPVRRLIKYSWVGLVAATLGVLASFGPYAAWVPLSGAFDPRLLSATLESDTGAGLLSRLYLLVPITLGIVWLMGSAPAETTRDRWLRGGTVLGCAAALAATWSFARSRPPGSLTPVALTVDIVLLIAVSISVTGLVMLWLLLRGNDQSAPSTAVPRLFRVAMVCAGMLVITGAYHAWRLVRGFDAVTSYGWLLAGMLALGVLLIGIAVLSRSWMRRQSASPPVDVAANERAKGKKGRGPVPSGLGRFRRQIACATGIAGLIVGTTAVLVTTQPPNTAHAQESVGAPLAIRQQAPPFRLPFDTGRPGGQGSVDLVLLPVTAGQNEVRIDTHISVLGERGTVKDGMAVTAVLNRPDGKAPPLPVQLSQAGPGHSLGSASIPSHGRWELALTLRATDGSQQTLVQPIELD
jgi:copper transport protein